MARRTLGGTIGREILLFVPRFLGFVLAIGSLYLFCVGIFQIGDWIVQEYGKKNGAMINIVLGGSLMLSIAWCGANIMRWNDRNKGENP